MPNVQEHNCEQFLLVPIETADEVCGLLRVMLFMDKDAAIHLCWEKAKQNIFTSTELKWSQKLQTNKNMPRYQRRLIISLIN